MARRAAAVQAGQSKPGESKSRRALGGALQALRTVGMAALITCGFCGALWGYFSVRSFVVGDPRFLLPGPPEPGVISEHFRVEGLRYATEQQVISVFLPDFGRSIYACDIAERRRHLLAVDWVRDATVSRIWPNRLHVRIEERTPVAFVQTPPREGLSEYRLIDADGVLLNLPHRTASLALPVLTGVTAGQTETQRAERVRRFLRVQRELGTAMAAVSDIDVTDPSNISVVYTHGGRAATLMLGDRNFGPRLRNYIDNQEEIRRRMPDAALLDLRLEERITAIGSNPVQDTDTARLAQPVAKGAGR